MEYAPGPVSLVPASVVPAPGDRRTFEAIAARLVGDLNGAGVALAVSAGTLSRSGVDVFEARTAHDAGALMRALADQPIAASSPRPDVVAAINAIEPLIDGLTSDIGRDLNRPLPEMWTFPPMPRYKLEDGGGGGDPQERARLLGRMNTWFQAHFGRLPTNDERVQFNTWWDNNNPVTDAQLDAWLDATFGDGGGGGNEQTRQRQVFEQWFVTNKGRGPSGDEQVQFLNWWLANEPVTDDQLRAWAQQQYGGGGGGGGQKDRDRQTYRGRLAGLFNQYLNRDPNDGEYGTFENWFDGAWPIDDGQFQSWVVATFGGLLNL